ncbi:SufD family Fe-S cluster assembly protein [candidate division WWE3 bacterium]|nr:SufD family Fe-S cluster assembly protein [candidate division WWE3 bacterium]
MTSLVKLEKDYQSLEVDSGSPQQIILDLTKPVSNKALDVIMNNEGSEVEILGVYVASGDERVEVSVNAIHKAPNTKCLTQIRGVLKGSAFSSFKGMIKIEKNAQLTNSYLDDDVLLLSDKAKSESQPMLEIEADDVKATHGATIGRILPEHLFYLQSRGLSGKEAEDLIVQGFLEPVISKIKNAKVRKLVYDKALEKL